jgi:hypothetical protein
MKKYLLTLLVLPLISCALLPAGLRTLPAETQITHQTVVIETALLSIQTTVISLNDAKVISDEMTRKTLDYIKQANQLAVQLKAALIIWHEYGTSDVAQSLYASFKQAIYDLKNGLPSVALTNINIKANLEALLAAYGG